MQPQGNRHKLKQAIQIDIQPQRERLLEIDPDTSLQGELPERPSIDQQPSSLTSIFRTALTFGRILTEGHYSESRCSRVMSEINHSIYNKDPFFRTMQAIDDSLQSRMNSAPYIEYLRQLDTQDFDKLAKYSRSKDKIRTEDSWLSDFTSPSYFNRHFAIPTAVVEEVTKCAKLFFDKIQEDRLIEGFVEKLKIPAPLATQDTSAVKVSLIPHAAFTLFQERFLNQYFIHFKPETQVLGAAVLSGLSSIAINQIERLFCNTFVSQLINETDLHLSSNRIKLALERVRFHPERLSQRRLFESESIDNVELGLEMAHRRHTLFKEALELAQKRAVMNLHRPFLEDFISGVSRAPAVKELPFSTPKTITIQKPHPNEITITYQLEIGANDSDRSLLLVKSDPITLHEHKPLPKESLTFFILDEQNIVSLDTLSMIPLSEDDWQRYFPSSDASIPSKELIEAVYASLHSDLQIAQEELPEVFSRSTELPDQTLVQVNDNLIVLSFDAQEGDTLRQFFSYDPQALQLIDLQLKKAPVPNRFSLGFSRLSVHEKGFDASQKKERSDPAAIRREVSRLLFSNVSNFAEFFNILRKHFEVTLSNQGNGGHKGLHRFGYYFPISANFRSETDPLNHQIALKVLDALKIPLEEVIELLRKY